MEYLNEAVAYCLCAPERDCMHAAWMRLQAIRGKPLCNPKRTCPSSVRGENKKKYCVAAHCRLSARQSWLHISCSLLFSICSLFVTSCHLHRFGVILFLFLVFVENGRYKNRLLCRRNSSTTIWLVDGVRCVVVNRRKSTSLIIWHWSASASAVVVVVVARCQLHTEFYLSVGRSNEAQTTAHVKKSLFNR